MEQASDAQANGTGRRGRGNRPSRGRGKPRPAAEADEGAPAAAPAAAGEDTAVRRRAPRRKPNPQPAENGEKQPRAARNDLSELPDEPDSIRVSGVSKVAAVAGKIAHTVRGSLQPSLSVVGKPSINQAVKAIAVARKYLADDKVDVCFQPSFRTENHGRAYLSLKVVPTDPAVPAPSGEELEIRVSSKSRHAKVGGALAARVREHANVTVTAVGIDAVTNATMAACHARFFLASDNLDLRLQPEFVTTEKGGTELTAVKMHLSVAPVTEAAVAAVASVAA